MAVPARLTRSSLSALYNSYIHTAQSFQSYNFREYFVRVSERKFGEELNQAIGSSSSTPKFDFKSLQADHSSPESSLTPSSSASAEEDILASISPEQKENFKQWWDKSVKDLEQLKRASVVNSLYIAPRLVVEGRGNVMTQGGGGAGAEASAGGAGQVVDPDHTSRP